MGHFQKLDDKQIADLVESGSYELIDKAGQLRAFRIRENLIEIIETLRSLPRFEWEEQEMVSLARLMLRYVDKADDKYSCIFCRRPLGKPPLVPYFKGHVHVDCYKEHKGNDPNPEHFAHHRGYEASGDPEGEHTESG